MDPRLTERLAEATVAALLDAEAGLIARIARALGRGLDAPDWAERQLLEVQRYRRETQAVLVVLDEQVGVIVNEAVALAGNRGRAAAVGELGRLLGDNLDDVAARLPGARALQALTAEAVGNVRSMTPRILRTTTDAYRSVIADVTGRVALGTQTRREAAQVALDRFARRGVTGFVDRAGRSWDMASYAEMSVRTATRRAATEAHSQTLQDAGLDLVYVSDAPQECAACRPWEGKVLSLSGRTRGTVEVLSRVDDGMVRVTVAGSLAEATAGRGLYHPGCRHSHSAYLPGATRLPTSTEDPDGDAARQRLRALERRLRAAKRVQAAALDDDAARRAGVRVRAVQAEIRAHVATTTAKRQPQREQIGRAR